MDWDLEAGAIVRRACELRAPAPFFERVKDYPGQYLFGAPLATFRRVATAMDLAPDTPYIELVEEFSQRTQKPIKPVLVKDAPCKENIIRGEEVDLFKFPAPMVHDGDGGRYLSTWHFITAKDPDTGWVNWGMYRQMIHNEKILCGLCLPYSDKGRILYGKYAPKNQPMPFATVIGADPLCSIIATTPLGVGKSEVDFAGGLRKEPVELVRCETVDLEVPAHAEIVIEAEVFAHEAAEEGPFGEYTGYRSSPRAPRVVYRVKAITHRSNPILTMSNMGIPMDDCASAMSIALGAQMGQMLKEQGFPITGFYFPPEFATGLVVIGVEATYSHIATQIGSLIFGHRALGPWLHQVIVVDKDVDPFNINEVLHTLSTRCHPVRGITIIDHAPGSPLTPFLSYEERRWGKGAKIIYDCTWPLDWSKERDVPPRVSFREVYPQEIQDRVLKNWQDYGYKTP